MRIATQCASRRAYSMMQAIGPRGRSSGRTSSGARPDGRLPRRAPGRASVESGQVVVNKRLCWRPLQLAWWYNDHGDWAYLHGHGDRHTFEVAWARLGAPTSAMKRPPGRATHACIRGPTACRCSFIAAGTSFASAQRLPQPAIFRSELLSCRLAAWNRDVSRGSANSRQCWAHAA
jgi:hypothetical protein